MERLVNPMIQWQIKSVVDEAPRVRSLHLESTHGSVHFIPGQYITITLPDMYPTIGKSYSISSIPSETQLRITVKAMGTFSTRLYEQAVGGTLTTTPPYGFFYPDDDITNVVCLVGGIGITPCMSIIKNLIAQNHPHRITLCYTNRTMGDIVFKHELDDLKRNSEVFEIHHFITRESDVPSSYIRGRMTAHSLSMLMQDTTNDTTYFVCGSIGFTRDMWRLLRNAGVSSRSIYTEGFY